MQEYSTIMANATCYTHDPQWTTSVASTINDAIIDNSAYTYFLETSHFGAGEGYKLGGVVIEYTVNEPLP